MSRAKPRRASASEQAQRRFAAATVVVACALYAVYCLVTQRPGPVTAPDSAAYLEMRPIVPIGYPLVLRAVGPRGAVVLQPVVFSAALAVFGLELLRATRSTALALVIIIGTFATPGLAEIHASLLTESLFMSALAVFLAAAVAFVRQPSWKAAALAGAIAGIAATVRRAALAWLPVLVLTCALVGRRHNRSAWTMTAAGVVPMLSVLAVDQAASRAVHGSALTSLTGSHLLAKAALLDVTAPLPPEADESKRRVAEHVDLAYAPIRALLRGAPGDLRAPLTLYYETCLQGPCVSALRASLAPLPEAQINDLFAAVGRERIERAPLEFIRLTATHVGSLWTAYKLRHPDTSARLTAFLESNRPLPFEREAFKVPLGDRMTFTPAESVRWLQPLVLAAGWFTAIAGAVSLARLAVGRASSLAAITGVAALTGHATLLFSAIAAAGISRFTVSASPALVAACCSGMWWALTAVRQRYRTP